MDQPMDQDFNLKTILTNLLDISTDNIYIKDKESRFVLINKAQAKWLGCNDPQDAVGKTDRDFFAGVHADRSRADEQAVMKTGKPLNMEEPNEFDDGRRTWVLTKKYPFFNEKQEIIGTFGITRDLTDINQAENYLRERYFTLQINEDFNIRTILQNILDSSTDVIYFKDKESRFVLVNQAQAQWLGCNNPQEAIGKTDRDFFTEVHANRARADEIEVMQSGKPLNTEELNEFADGRKTWVLTKKYPFYNEKQEIIGTFGITRDITETKKLSELEEVHRQMTQFFVNIAHETKTPLTLIKNYLEKYIRKVGTDPDLIIIKRNIDKLLQEMVDYLDEEKLKRGQVFYDHNQITDLTGLIQEKLILFQELAATQNVTITSDLTAGVTTKADPLALERVLNNLLDNAIKYNQVKGQVHLSLTTDQKRILLKVRDTGIGIQAEQMKYLFQPYYQLSHPKRNIQGIGMGLSIVKAIVDSLGGEIKVESKINQGTVFTIILHQYLPSGEEAVLQDFQFSAPTGNTVIAEFKATGFKENKPTLLIVEDNMEMLSFLYTALNEKYNVFPVTGGEEALSKIKSIPTPDLIISDIMMHEVDGHQFLVNLARMEGYKHIPFIFLTAKTTSGEKIKGLSEGAIDYIYKPFLLDELLSKIESVIQNHTRLREQSIKEFKEKILEVLQGTDPKSKSGEEDSKIEEILRNYQLTKREKEIAQLMIQGFLNKEIVYKLEISIKTLDHHIQSLYKKLQVSNRIEFMKIFR